ncbi:DNA cytosine methyltransferase [uncultured Sphingomonas sp.]|uniref:DNA cytosine methyltransferase n=1 Tax=uncultured Sphingomonas sp. TaxID=158754 RepID=UPI0025E586F5|nr:DNA cytosine methyltransferase [uncultured Sphingomonas sp.]
MGTGLTENGLVKRNGAKRRRIVAVDMFCGAGGLAYGLSSAGLKVAAGVDMDPRCRFPIEQNCRAKFIEMDVAKVTGADLRKWFGKADVRVLAGCAPCQPFSTYSQSRKSPDPRWELLTSFQRLAIDTLPEIVTMENVAGLKSRKVWEDFVESLKGAGYEVSWGEVACTDYGVPQKRKRLVLLASRLGPITLPAPTHAKIFVSVADAIGSLPRIAAGEQAVADPLHAASSLSATNMKRIRASRPGGTWRDWPAGLRAACHQRATGATYPAVYGRMEWRKPSPTITTQCYGYGSGRFGHPEQDRAISLREAAILQSFPPTYRFVEADDQISFRGLGILIGNAVPPKLAEAIGHTIREHVEAMTV